MVGLLKSNFNLSLHGHNFGESHTKALQEIYTYDSKGTAKVPGRRLEECGQRKENDTIRTPHFPGPDPIIFQITVLEKTKQRLLLQPNQSILTIVFESPRENFTERSR